MENISYISYYKGEKEMIASDNEATQKILSEHGWSMKKPRKERSDKGVSRETKVDKEE